MGFLRLRLSETEQPLYEVLERCWKIADAEWLSSIPTSMGSYNSLPHFRNIESHLDAIIQAHETSGGVEILNPLENYLLLSAVLFHDIGRTRPNDHADHPWISKRLIETQYAELGIPSREIAFSLARICVYHDPGKKNIEDARKQLNQTSRIDPYGTANELKVGTLLALADHMDGSFRRSAPQYIASPDEIEIKGAFRRLITGVSYDPIGKLIKTSICQLSTEENQADVLFELESAGRIQELVDIGKLKNRSKDKLLVTRTELQKAAIPKSEGNKRNCRHLLQQFDVKDVEDVVYTSIIEGCARIQKQSRSESVETLAKSVASRLSVGHGLKRRTQIMHAIADLLSKTDAHASDSNANGANDPNSEELPTSNIAADKRDRSLIDQLLHAVLNERWPDDLLVAAVLSDLRNNAVFLDNISDDLRRFGIAANAWLLELDGRLFNYRGWETFEPVLSKDWMCSVTKAMWKQSIEVFGVWEFTYEALANSLQIQNLDVVRLAVARIKDVASEAKEGGRTDAEKNKQVISVTAEGWRWIAPEVDWKSVNDMIEQLEEEHAPRKH